MFYSDFIEKNQSRIVLHELEYYEFIELFYAMYLLKNFNESKFLRFFLKKFYISF